MTASPPPARAQPLRDLDAWAAHFVAAPIPVLAATAHSIEELRDIEDEVDAHLLAEPIAVDPLMTLKLMACVAQVRSPRCTTDPETVTAALVMLGIAPFFRAFDTLDRIEDRLAGHPRALQGLQAVLSRAHRGAAFALAFAVHRMDHDAHVIHTAALLHDFAEMLLWLNAPELALRIADLQRDDPGLRSASAQRQVLNIELQDLQQQLMRAWRLPELLVLINDERHASSAQVRNVLLALRLARHTARGWDNAALPDDVRDIASLLNMGEVPTLHLLRDIDA
jgi:HD-like signal output (HDOD) protein